MKTFLVLSDSHGRRKNLDVFFDLIRENDYLVFLGDGISDVAPFQSAYPDKAVVLRGNCDFSYAEGERVLEAEGVRIFCCHGHAYGVKGTLSRLAERAEELRCTVALYGHTHRADITETDGVLCINPGAAGSYSDPSYCYLAVHAGKVTPVIVPLQPK